MLEYGTMASNLASALVTEVEYLERERAAEFRSEYFSGVVVAMSGGSRNHGRAGANLFGEMYVALRYRDCALYHENMRVRIPDPSSYLYPDIAVECGKDAMTGGHLDIIFNPMVIVEVLSPSTEKFDREEKFRLYKQIASLREYILVSQREPLIWRFDRATGFKPAEEARGLGATLRIASLDIAISLAAIYRGVEFD